MLILEIPSTWGRNHANQWNFPRRIRPLTAGAESMHGVVYDIVGRAFTNGGHFTATYTPDSKRVYQYDDMHNGGCSVLDADARIDSHLAGKIPPKSGWRTYAVIYHLRGGTYAQSFFTKYQLAAAQRVHSIRFSTPENTDPYTIPPVVGFDLPNFLEVECEDRFWLSNPWRTDMLDFISSRSPLATQKRVRFITQPDGSEEDVSDSPPSRPSKLRHRASHLISSDDESGPEARTPSSGPTTNTVPGDGDDPDEEGGFSCRCGTRHGPGENGLKVLD
jgi:hypothetical protein